MTVSGRTVILTGAAGGIGRATAAVFVADGAHVVLTDRDAAPLAALAQALGRPDQVTTVVADGGDPDAAEQIVDAALAATGRIDDVVLAAGVYPESSVAAMGDADWDACLGINLDAPFRLCRAVAPHLGPGASIVGLTSIAGQRGSRNHAHYAASKAGLLAFLRSLALELAPDVRVNAVAPGTIETPMTAKNRETMQASLLASTPLARFGTPAEVAGVIHFLCTPAAGFMTGQELSVNGGMHVT